MEKLKCTSCNGDLELDEKHEIATCKFCGTKYKLDGDKTIVLKLEDVKMPHVNPKDIDKAFRPVIIVFVGIFILAVSLIIIFSLNMSKKSDVSRFNLDFTYASGTQQPLFVADTLDKVNTKNKTNDKHKITVVFRDVETQDEDEINNIKKRVTQVIGVYTKYEVKLYYDKDGYVNKIVIED